jgi:hypothetical protein
MCVNHRIARTILFFAFIGSTFYLEDLMCTTTAIVEQTVRDYITYYSIRIQAKLNNQSPVDFRRLAA